MTKSSRYFVRVEIHVKHEVLHDVIVKSFVFRILKWMLSVSLQ